MSDCYVLEELTLLLLAQLYAVLPELPTPTIYTYEMQSVEWIAFRLSEVPETLPLLESAIQPLIPLWLLEDPIIALKLQEEIKQQQGLRQRAIDRAVQLKLFELALIKQLQTSLPEPLYEQNTEHQVLRPKEGCIELDVHIITTRKYGMWLREKRKHSILYYVLTFTVHWTGRVEWQMTISRSSHRKRSREKIDFDTKNHVKTFGDFTVGKQVIPKRIAEMLSTPIGARCWHNRLLRTE